MATLPPWRPKEGGQLAEVPTQDEAAKLFSVGDRSIQRAKRVLDSGCQPQAPAEHR
jgi:hypothetical protein